jgi:ABC-2 type transport system permease protein
MLTQAATTEVSPTHSSPVHNAAKLLRFFLRIDRIWLPIWIIGVLILNIAFAPYIVDMAPNQSDLLGYAQTMQNPAMIAICGPFYSGTYTYGILFVQMMTVWCVMLSAVMNFFLVLRHTRKDEEEGRTEVLRSLPVGRVSGLFSTMVLMLGTNILIGVISGAGLAAMGLESFTVQGCWILGAIFGVTGILFGGVALFFSQLCSTGQGVTGACFATLGALYLARAVGDVQGNILSNISPLGIMFKTQPFVENNWWPMAVILAEAIVIIAIALLLASRRDLGSGLLPQRKGRAHAGAALSNAAGLALRLVRPTLIAWLITLFILGLAYGSVFGDFETFMADNAMLQAIIAADTGAGASMLNDFLAFIIAVMSCIAVIPVITIVLKIRSEEKRGRIEQLYTSAVSRSGNLLAYLAISFAISLLAQLLQCYALWLATSMVMQTPFELETLIIAGLVYLPAFWLFIGLGAALIGLAPKLTPLLWVYFGYAFFVLYLGRLLNLPQILTDLSVFSAIPLYPTNNITAAPLIIITIISLALVAVGTLAYRRRDLQ